jgi:hypothetical protein
MIIRAVGAIISKTESCVGTIGGASSKGRGRIIFAFSITSPHLPSGVRRIGWSIRKSSVSQPGGCASQQPVVLLFLKPYNTIQLH